jgi:hypothetical protein
MHEGMMNFIKIQIGRGWEGIVNKSFKQSLAVLAFSDAMGLTYRKKSILARYVIK